LSSKRNHCVWLAMICLSLIAECKPREIFENRATLIRDNGIKTPAKVAETEVTYRRELFWYLPAQLESCRPQSVLRYGAAVQGGEGLEAGVSALRRVRPAACFESRSKLGGLRMGFEEIAALPDLQKATHCVAFCHGLTSTLYFPLPLLRRTVVLRGWGGICPWFKRGGVGSGARKVVC
jgi:hypothetical protein